jgi:hypothetical protein
MLKGIRKHTKIIIWATVGIFILCGGYSITSSLQKKNTVAGSVFGKDVYFQEYELFLKAAQIFSFSPNTVADADRIKQAAWQNLIMSREAKRQKIEVSDDEVLREILRLMASANITNPTPEVYKRWIQGTLNEAPKAFESKIREYLRIQKLMKKVNEEAVETPSEEQIKNRYQQHNAQVSFKMAVFPTMEEILNLQTKVKDPEAWGKELGVNTGNVETVNLAPLDEISKTKNINLNALWRLYSAEKGSVSDPFQTGANQFAIALIVDKVPADDSKMDDASKEKYKQEISEQKKFERFMIWSSELQQRADLKDYLPSSSAAEEPDEDAEPVSAN